MPNIEELNIEINASAVRANDAISRLNSKLDKLNSSINKIEGSKLSGLANEIKNLGSSMQIMNSVKTQEFSRFVNNIQKFSKIDTAGLNRTASAIQLISKSVNRMGNFSGNAEKFSILASGLKQLGYANINKAINNITLFGKINASSISETAKAITQAIKSFSSIGDLSKGAEQMSVLANGIKQLGYKSAGTAIKNIPELAKSMKKLMKELSNAPKVSQNLIDMTNALAKLARTGASSGRAADSLAKSFEKMPASISTTTKSIGRMRTAFGGLISSILPYIGIWQLFSFGKQAVDISSDLTEVQNVIDVTFGKFKDRIEEFSKTSITDFGMSELTAKTMAGRFQAMGTAMGFAQGQMAEMSVSLTELAADMASFYNVEQDAVATSLQSIFTGETEPLRKYGLDLTHATLQEWALKQGIDANMESMSQMEKTLLRYQYVMANTSAAQGDFKRTMDSWHNQIVVLRQNFQVLASIIGGTLINALKPFVKALNNALLHVINFAKVVSNSLGKIFGWKYEESGGGVTNENLGTDMSDVSDSVSGASDDAGDLSDNLKDATKNAKKLKTVVLGIDELNINSPDNDTETSSGTGSSGSGDDGTGTGLGDIGSGTNATGKWVKDQEKFFESNLDSLYKLGDYIGNALTEAMNRINWNKIYSKAKNFGKGLAEFLNGLISPELFGAVGRTIAGALNTAVYTALSFGQTFDWTNLGLSIANGINEFFRTFDFASLAETINVWVQGIRDTILTAITNIDWMDVYDGIIDFIENIDLETVEIIIDAIIIKKILGLKIGNKALTFIGTKLSQKIATILGTTLGLQLASGAGIGTALMTAGASMGAILLAGLKGFFGSSAAVSALSFMNPILVAITGIATVALGAFTSIFNFVDMLKEGFSPLKEAIMLVGIAITGVGAVILGVSSAVALPVAGIVAVFATGAILIKDNWKSISKFFKNLWKTIKNAFKDVKEFFKEKFSSARKAVDNTFKDIGTWFGGKWDDAKKKFSDVRTFFKGKFDSGYNAVTNAFDGIGTWFGKKWSGTKTKFSDVKEFFKNKFSSGYEAIKNSFKNLGIWASGRWDAVKSKFKNVKTFFKEAFSNAYDAIKNSFKNIGAFFDGIKSKIVKPIKSAINAVIKGLNWILKKFGSKNTLSYWQPEGYAKGSSGIKKDTIGVVNDQKGSTYREMVVPPNGKPFIPEGRNVLLPLEKGTKIMPAKQTKQLIGELPHFANGIGNFFGSAWEKIKDFTGNIFDYLSDPKKIVQIAIDKFVDTSRWTGIFADLAKGSINKIFDSAVGYIKNIFGESMSINYNPSAGVKQWKSLAEKALRITGQYSDSNLNALLIQMQHESGGNPKAINNWDINAKRGTPSKGLMQVIDPTFKAYAKAPYNKNIWDPLSNMIAAIRYTVSRYGSLYNGWTARGYIGYKGGIGKINFSDLIPKYSIGGFPEDGLFYANSTELVGKFKDGKTAVANNYQIEGGIEQATYKGFARAMAEENRIQEDLLRELISAVKEGKRISIDGRELVNAYDKRKTRNGYSFT